MICSVPLHSYACAHDLTVEHGVLVVLHEDRFNKHADLAYVAADVSPLAPVVGNFHLGHNDGDIDVAVKIGIFLSVGAVHINLGLGVVAGCYDLLVSLDDTDGFVSAESFSSIHCVSSLVVSIMYWQASLSQFVGKVTIIIWSSKEIAVFFS